MFNIYEQHFFLALARPPRFIKRRPDLALKDALDASDRHIVAQDALLSGASRLQLSMT